MDQDRRQGEAGGEDKPSEGEERKAAVSGQAQKDAAEKREREGGYQ